MTLDSVIVYTKAPDNATVSIIVQYNRINLPKVELCKRRIKNGI